MSAVVVWLAALDWPQITWSALCLIGVALIQYYREAGDPVKFDEGTSPP